MSSNLMLLLVLGLLVRHIDCQAQWSVTTLAGSAAPGYVDGSVPNARFNLPQALVISGGNQVAVADPGNHRIRAISLSPLLVSTLAGSGSASWIDGVGTQAAVTPAGLTVGIGGVLYFCDMSRIRSLLPSGSVATLAGSSSSGFSDGTGSQALFSSPFHISFHPDGSLYVADTNNQRIRRVTTRGVVTTFAGNGQANSYDGTGTAAGFTYPCGVVCASDGKVYVADSYASILRSITTLRVVTTLAVTVTSPTLWVPTGITISRDGTLFIADRPGQRVYSRSPAGTLSILAGSGTNEATGYADGIGSNAAFNEPVGITCDSNGVLYVADGNGGGNGGNSAVRVVSPVLSASCPPGYFCTPGGTPFLCPDGWFAPIGSKFCYAFFPTTTLSWLQSNEQCSMIAANGTLATIRSIEEANTVNAMSSSPLCYGLNSMVCSVPNGGAFIGLYSNTGCGGPPLSRACSAWQWVRPGEISTFALSAAGQALWCGSEPNAVSGPIYVQWIVNGCMNDHDNVIDLNFVGGYTCEAPQAGVCPPGFFCPALSTVPSPCPQNTFSLVWGASSSSTCTSCPTGTISSGGAQTCVVPPSPSVTPSVSPTVTTSATITPTHTPSATRTPTYTPSATASFSGTTSATASLSGTPTITPSASRTNSPSATPLTCEPGTFVAPGTYTCARCPLGFFSAATGPITSCTSCSPQVSSSNSTSCINCPALQRSNGTGLCEACPVGRYCDGTGTDFPCLPPVDVCAGDLQGCRAGHSGFLCSACAQGFFMSPSSYCSPCTNSFFALLPAVLASAVIVPLFYWTVRSDLQYLTTYLAQLRLVLSKYDITLSILCDHLLRLSLLKRLASFLLPSLFGWLTGFVSLVFGFNIMGSGAECVDPTWSFTKTFGTVFGVGAALTAVTLVWDLSTFNRGNGVTINKWSWRVWDTLAFCLPFAVQTSWEALTHLNVNGQERLWGSPTMPWEIFSATSVIAILTITLQLFFILFRFLLPCYLTVERSIDASGQEVVRPVDKPRASDNPSAFSVLDLYSTPAARLMFARNVLAFLRSAAIPLQMNGQLAPAAWLISLSVVELALAFYARKALVRELGLLRVVGPVQSAPPPAASQGWQAAAWLLMLAVFTITHVCAIFCAATGTCSSLTGLGVFLILLNALPFALFFILILRVSLSAAASSGSNQVFPSSGMTPLPTASRRHMLALDHGKAVVLNQPNLVLPLSSTLEQPSSGLALRTGP